jgi:hypothetical protein
MELLPIDYTKNNCIYHQIKRDDKRALYSITYKENPDLIVGYDVFKVKIFPSFTFPGTNKISPEKEGLPWSEAFGSFAFSYSTLKAAEEKYEELNILSQEKRGRKKKNHNQQMESQDDD